MCQKAKSLSLLAMSGLPNFRQWLLRLSYPLAARNDLPRLDNLGQQLGHSGQQAGL
jgi:hypothetical protein